MANITKHTEQEIRLTFSSEDADLRLDKALSDILNDVSRSTLQNWIKAGHITVDEQPCRTRQTTQEHQAIHIVIPQAPAINVPAQVMTLDIVFEDETVLVINKPAGLVVHPGAGNHNGTLLNGLLAHEPTLAHLARGGIVHRLDKLTTGLMVVAKTEAARQNLIEQLSARSVKRQYLALVYGTPIAGGSVKEPMGRHPKDRRKMVVRPDGKTAITHFRINKKYQHTSLLNVSLETGRTHQIRVHMAYKQLPLVGDRSYGKRLQLPKYASPSLISQMQGFKRQALHAEKLALIHPKTQQLIQWHTPMPEDMQQLCTGLEDHKAFI